MNHWTGQAPIRFATSTVSATTRSGSNINSYSRSLATLAYHSTNSDDGANAAQQQSVITVVAQALERNLADPDFASLTAQEQEAAAVKLVQQCQQGLQMVNTLRSALLNPATMAHQLRANALGNNNFDVLEQILRTHRPSTVIASRATARTHRIGMADDAFAI